MPDIIVTQEEFLNEITLHAQYMEAAKNGTIEELPTPIPDPLNDERGWQCCKISKKPHRYSRKGSPKLSWPEKPDKHGTVNPRCPFFDRCHGTENREYGVRLSQDEEQRLVGEWQIEEDF